MTAHMEVNMGGYFSTRWGSTPTRKDTDPLLKLDIRTLHKMGALQPTALTTHEWKRGPDPAGSMQTYMRASGDALTLIYSRRVNDETWENVKEPVWLDATPCTYGGERPWFRCPRCSKRCAVLFGLSGYFRCRTCHDLAYSSTREDAYERALRRTRTFQGKLGGTSDDDAFTIPPKPGGMTWSRYDQLRSQLRDAMMRQSDLLEAEFSRWFGHLR